DNVYKATFGFFHPYKKTKRVMIYHHGYASDYDTQKAHFKTLLRAGFAVIAHNLTGYGDSAPFQSWSEAKRPLRAFFEPVVASINYAMDKFGYEDINMMGLSAGGWMTAVAAAMDKRIKRSYPVAGVLPIYLRREKETASPQYYEPMLKAAGYLDMFILGSWGEGRKQLQIFNRYDRCCFANSRGKLYEAAVAEAVGKLGSGAFGVMIDESHARHKLSALGMKAILADVNK
ncbi:MAG TPA: alpha/beta fold hydrolase, partial [Rhodospirillales bacterium]|nr:alpha/beta fold hydrolase [Rhodospirillales bacterium]